MNFWHAWFLPEAPHVFFIQRNQQHLAPPMLGLHCTHFLRHEYPSTPHPFFPIFPKIIRGPRSARFYCQRGFTVHEKRKVDKEQPNPAAAHHTITTARRPDNTRTSALEQSWFTQLMSRLSCRPRRRSSKMGSHFWHLSRIFKTSLVGQSAGLSVSTTPVRFRQKLQKSRAHNLYLSTQSFESY